MKKFLTLFLFLASCSQYIPDISDIPDIPDIPEQTTKSSLLPAQEEFSITDLSINKSGEFWEKKWPNSSPLFTEYERPLALNNSEYDTARNLSTAKRFIVVNIPAQTLRVFENGHEIIRSKVIIGKSATRTPTQRSNITAVKLNPNWTAPAGGNIERTYTRMIQNGEAHKLRQINIDWHTRTNGTYQFYQKPGKLNVLGRVKFEMYSPSNTYLHDTNRPDLFNLSERFISFGCIRVEKWDELAAWMLGWSKTELHDYLEINTTTEYKNIDNVEIHIVYWVNETLDGQQVTWPNYYNR